METEIVVSGAEADPPPAMEAAAGSAVEIAEIEAEQAVAITESNNAAAVEIAEIAAAESDEDIEWLGEQFGGLHAKLDNVLMTLESRLTALLEVCRSATQAALIAAAAEVAEAEAAEAEATQSTLIVEPPPPIQAEESAREAGQKDGHAEAEAAQKRRRRWL